MELEYKFFVSEKEAMAILGKVEESYDTGEMELIAMTAKYFDTEDFSLRKRGIAIRRRKENHDGVATIKWNGRVDKGMHIREEVNVPMIDAFPLDSHCFVGTKAEGLITDKEFGELKAFLTMNFRRVQFTVNLDNARCMMSYDMGTILGNEKEIPISEIEIELLEGDGSKLMELEADLRKKFGMKAAEKSKFEQGLSLYF